jgi:hypothetical protein
MRKLEALWCYFWMKLGGLSTLEGLRRSLGRLLMIVQSELGSCTCTGEFDLECGRSLENETCIQSHQKEF